MIQIIKSTNILPESSDYNDVQLAAFRFDKYTDYIIRKHVHQILVMVMESYSKLCEEYSKHNLNLYTVHQSVQYTTPFLNQVDFIDSFL